MKHFMHSILFILTLVLVANTANAVNIQTFRPNVGTDGSFRLHSSTPTQPFHLRTGLFANYMHKPLRVRSDDGSVVRDIVKMGATLDLGAEFGLHKYIALGVNVPTSFTKHLPATSNTNYNNSFSVGDVLAYAKVAILHSNDFPLGIGIIPFIEAPSGSLSKFTGEDGIDFGATLVVDKQIGPVYLTANMGYRGRQANDETIGVFGFPNAVLNLDDEFTYGLGVSVNAIPDRLDVIGEVAGSTLLQSFGSDRESSPLEGDLGIRTYFHDKKGAVTVGGGLGIIRGYSAPLFRTFAGIQYEFGKSAPAQDAEEEYVVRKTIDLEGVHFHSNDHGINAAAQTILAKDLQTLHQEPELQILIEGHTDNRGSDAYNQRLSERRAQSVKDYFIRHGIAAARLHAVGYGESRPLVPNTSDANMAKNRRVVITILEYR